MATMAERIIEQLRIGAPLDDDVLAKRVGVMRQAINQTARGLESKGIVKRYVGPDGKIVNELVEGAAPRASASATTSATSVSPPALSNQPPVWVPGQPRVTEDEVKQAMKDLLEADGYRVTVAWGHTRGIDIEAARSGSRLAIEAKGEAPAGPQQHNYFLNALGELVKGIDDPDAEYGLALPDNRQFVGLVERLPALARERLRLRVWLVRRDGATLRVREV